MIHTRRLFAVIFFIICTCIREGSGKPVPAGEWTAAAPRAEIRPVFLHEPDGGPGASERLIIEHDGREGLHGWWARAFPVSGGQPYRFSCFRRVQNVDSPRRSGVVRVLWRDDHDRPVVEDRPLVSNYRGGWTPNAEAEYPADRETDADCSTHVTGTFQAPADVKNAVVELHLQWAPGGRVEFSLVQMTPIARTA